MQIINTIIIVQDTQKQCGPICVVEGKIREHDFLFMKRQLIWLFKKNFKTCLIGDEKRKYSVWPYTNTENITAVWEQIYLFPHY